jgi:pilus assembly protein Flp/PilA
MQRVIDALSRTVLFIEALRGQEDGQALVEYGLLVGLIAVVCVGAVTLLGTNIKAYFDAINAAL